MTTIKVTPEVAAIVSVTVKKLRARGQKDMTASKLLYDMLIERHPESVKLIESDEEGVVEYDGVEN